MTIISFFTSLFSILSGSGYFKEIVYGLCLTIDGVIYSLLSVVYNLFLLMCQINLNYVYSIASGLIDKIEAVVLVFIVFKIGVTLIQMLLEPDGDAIKKGSSLVKNIFITIALLISYNFIFGFVNELCLLVLGVPDNYEFTVLNQFIDVENGSDEGLIVRFIFGSDNETTDIGDYIAYETLSMFLQDDNDEVIKAISVTDGYDFTKISNVSSKIDKTIKYIPILGGLVGLFLSYEIAICAFKIGVRMFKLIVLQIIAPIAIISIIEKGTKDGPFKKFCSLYFNVVIDAFVRITAMLVVTVFVVKFFANISSFFGDLGTTSKLFSTANLLALIVILAGFKFIGEAPAFLNKALGLSLDEKNKATSFASNLPGILAGGAIGGLAGGLGGLATGISSKTGFGGTVANMLAGAGGGLAAGAKGNNISEKVKNLSAAGKKNSSRAQDWARRGFGNAVGGALGTTFGVKNRQDLQMYKYEQQEKALAAYEAAQKEEIKDYKVGDAASPFSWGEIEGSDGSMHSNSELYNSGYENIKLGDDKDAFAGKMLEFDKSYVESKAIYDSAVESGNERLIKSSATELASVRQTALKRAGDVYDHNKNSAHNDNVKAKEAGVVGSGAKVIRRDDGSINAKDTGNEIARQKHALENKKSYSNTHGASKEK